jgi:hypothetical protein
MKKPADLPEDSGRDRKPETCPLGSRYASLFDFLVEQLWDDGTQRQPGTLLVCYGEGRFRGWLNDRELQRNAWASAETLTQLLETLDGKLAEGSFDWRRSEPDRKWKRK